ncbi:MAG: hypothetical protein JNM59_11765, partial [Hyphomonadaceae bacterium]|nr:hypothetical protein [Hyphomonadaceae bacterium]
MEIWVPHRRPPKQARIDPKQSDPVRTTRTLAAPMQPDAAPIPDRTAPRALWTIAQTLLDILYTLFG